jgi:hypothetical protein
MLGVRQGLQIDSKTKLDVRCKVKQHDQPQYAGADSKLNVMTAG